MGCSRRCALALRLKLDKTGRRTSGEEQKNRAARAARFGDIPSGYELAAARELEGVDAGVPLEAAGGLDVLLRVEECAVIGGVNRHVRIVTPAIGGILLDAGARDDILG